MPLTDIKCKNAKPTDKIQKMFDGGGLYLEISPKGNKYWRLKYRYMGKEKRLAFGVYPQISLKDARNKRDDAKRQLSENIDPSFVKKQAKREIFLKTENQFEIVAREWHETKKGEWS